MKKKSPNRAAIRAGKPAPFRYPEATPQYIQRCCEEYVLEQRRQGKLFSLEDATTLTNDATRRAIQIVYTAVMESHVAGVCRILRDVEPVVTQMYKDLDRMTCQDGIVYADAKMAERYRRAKKGTFRPIRGLEHLVEEYAERRSAE